MKFTYKQIINSLEHLGVLELFNLDKAIIFEIDKREKELKKFKRVKK